MKINALTALLGTILLSVYGAFSEVYLTNGTWISGLYYFLIIGGTLIIPMFISTWIYSTLLLKLSGKNVLYRVTIGIMIALFTLVVLRLVDKVPSIETIYFFIGSSILLVLIHLLIERKYKTD
jgi:hypothetical protein